MGYREVEGIVLSRRNIFDDDQQVHLLTPEFGGLRVRAPNARTSQKVFCGRLEPPNLIRCRLYQSRESSRWVLSDSEIIEPLAELTDVRDNRGHLWPLLSLYRDLFPEGNEPGRAYGRLVKGLRIMDSLDLSTLLITDRLLVRTALDVGVTPEFTGCVRCGSNRARLWRLSPGRGLLCENCLDAGESELQFSDRVREVYLELRELPWSEIQDKQYETNSLAKIETLMYRFFHYHFEISLDAFQVKKSL